MPRRKFSDEFKREAVQLAKQPGVTKAQIARELGIGAGLLGRWTRELRESGGRAFPGHGKSRDAEITDLKRELARVKKERDFFARGGNVLRERPQVKYCVLDRCRERFPVRLMCRCLGVSPSGYYAWRSRPLSRRARDDQRLLRRIRALHEQSDGVFGSPRMWEEFRYEGETCGRNRVARLMRLHGIQGVPQARRWRKKASGQRPPDIRNHLARDFAADRPNAKWVSDITYSAPSSWRRQRGCTSRLEHVRNTCGTTKEGGCRTSTICCEMVRAEAAVTCRALTG